MKKVLFMALFAMVAFLMVGCKEESTNQPVNYDFQLILDDYSELRESIVVNVTLKDDLKQLANSQVTAELTKKDSTTILSSKKVNFDSEKHSAELKFTKLTQSTDYVLTVYTGYNGVRVDLLIKELKTSNLGTAENPYVLRTRDDFTKYLKNDRTAYFKLEADVDFEGKGVNPIFTSSSAFTGNFDGQGFTIKNYKVADIKTDAEQSHTHINTSTQYYGLFGYIGTTGVVKNLKIDNATIYIARKNTMSSSQTLYYGILAGYNAGIIDNVHVTNSNVNLKSTNRTEKLFTAGGLVGMNTGKGTIKNVSVAANINFEGVIDATVGGVVGTTLNSENVFEDGVQVPNISKASYNGTINVSITGSSGNDANTVIGGILGKNYRCWVDNCESTGSIIANTTYTSVKNTKLIVGGLLGWNLNDNARLNNSRSSMGFNVTAFDIPSDAEKVAEINAGLLVGRNGGTETPATALVTNCSYTLATGVEHIINTVNNNAKLAVKTGLFGEEVTENVEQGKTNTSNSTLDITVKYHALNEETKKFEPTEEFYNEHIEGVQVTE